MTPEFSLGTGKTALLAMDCQSAIVSAYARPEEPFIERATSVLRTARSAGMPVIHVKVGFRPALPEVSGRNMILRANEIDTLVLFGIATSGVVLSTLLEATDSDYRLVVIADCCADVDADLHTCLMERLFPKRADVITASEFVESMKAR